MNCTDINTILDEHRDARLVAAERGGVDAHLSGCRDCAAAWHALAQLRAITVPRMSPALLSRVLGAVSAQARPTHGARRGALIGTALLAGAALAALGVTQLREWTSDDSAPTSELARS